MFELQIGASRSYWSGWGLMKTGNEEWPKKLVLLNFSELGDHDW